ncbi:MAG: 3-isopropylmalate dehydratase small subunit [Deltaproteobacteria bacterium]|nr:3-isopropylmalate dehydratase small subunit [Deltaproteobacteria bacterium]
MQARGRCWKFGDNIPTDRIVRTDLVFRPFSEILKHVLETCNPEFPLKVKPGEIVVAGKHFGQSSGRAIAAKALKQTGIGCVIAESFARTFYRNGFEIGMPALECPGITAQVSDGDILLVEIDSGRIVNETTGRELQARPTPPFLLDMLKAGGLIPMAERLAGEG